MDFSRFERALGHRFTNLGLLQTALTHRSLGSDNNERFEFLGDGLLNFLVAESLYIAFADLPEGDLSRMRANLVKQESLYQLASVIELGSFLQLGDGEKKSGGHSRPSILADAFEAVLAAIYLDGGFEAARSFVDRSFAARISALDAVRDCKDPKTRLQEYLQARKYKLPVYRITTTHGEAHVQDFEVNCEIRAHRHVVTLGRGSSRRIAEQMAAQAALEELGA